MKMLKIKKGTSYRWHFCWAVIRETIEYAEARNGQNTARSLQTEIIKEDILNAESASEMQRKLSELFSLPGSILSIIPSNGSQSPLPALTTDCDRILRETSRYCMDPNARKVIANNVGFSENYLSKIFKEGFGINFSDYLRQNRMLLARGKVRHTNLRFDEIGRSIGYKTPSSFSAAYKKEYGVTPTCDRDNYLKKGNGS